MDETLARLVRAVERQAGRQHTGTRLYTYRDATRRVQGVVIRVDTTTGKLVRPARRRDDGTWEFGGMPAPRPLYRLPELLAAPAANVLVVEGEKCVLAARRVLAATRPQQPPAWVVTTSAGGAAAWAASDWTVLAGRRVLVLPDVGVPGMAYARGVIERLRQSDVRAHCAIAPQLPGLGDGEDVVDWLLAGQRAGQSNAALGAALQTHLDAALATITDATAPGESSGDAVRLRCYADIIERPIRWLWPGRLALGKLTLLAGRPGSGKSYLTCDWAARVSRGDGWPDDELTGAWIVEGKEQVAEAGDVLLVGVEDDPADTVLPRLRRARADLRRVWAVEGGVGTPQVLAGWLAEQLPRLPSVRLVVIDPAGSYLGGIDAHRDAEVRAAMLPLVQAIAASRAAGLLVAHTRKGLSEDLDESVLGSRAFVGLARVVLHCVPAADVQDASGELRAGKTNLGPPAPTLGYRITAEGVQYHPLGGDAVEDRTDVLAGLFGTHTELTAEELRAAAEASGLGWQQVRRLLAAAGIWPRRSSDGSTWLYRLRRRQRQRQEGQGWQNHTPDWVDGDARRE